MLIKEFNNEIFFFFEFSLIHWGGSNKGKAKTGIEFLLLWYNTGTKIIFRKGFISSYSLNFIIRRSGQELRAGTLETGTDAEAMKECSLLACSSWLANQLALPSRTTHPEAHLYQSLIEKMPPRLSHRLLRQGHCLNWGSLLPVAPACVELAEKLSTTDPWPVG